MIFSSRSISGLNILFSPRTSLCARKSFFTYLFWCVLATTLALESGADTGEPALQPTKAQSVTTIDILDKLSKRHYRNLPIDDKLSVEFLENYLKTLDPGRLYFLQADIDGFMKDKHQHDDQDQPDVVRLPDGPDGARDQAPLPAASRAALMSSRRPCSSSRRRCTSARACSHWVLNESRGV